MTTRRSRWLARSPRLPVVALALACTVLAGCSLLTIESPVKPLPPRDLEARILTRDFARNFATAVAAAADEVAAAEPDPAVAAATLRWKINATAASREAATQLAPMAALVDTWTLTGQMREFFDTGAGAEVFGGGQPIARAVAIDLDERMSSIVATVTDQAEYARYRDFVTRQVTGHPLTDLSFRRDSVIDALAHESEGEATLLASVGSVPEAMSDVADRVAMYGEQAPLSARWQVELALREAGYAEADIAEIVTALNTHLERISSLADSGPAALERSTQELRLALRETTTRLDRSSRELLRALHEEREALALSFVREREAVLIALAQQRAALTDDARDFAREWTSTVLDRGRSIVREGEIALVVLVLLILGLPFLAGLAVGRATAGSRRSVRSGD